MRNKNLIRTICCAWLLNVRGRLYPKSCGCGSLSAAWSALWKADCVCEREGRRRWWVIHKFHSATHANLQNYLNAQLHSLGQVLTVWCLRESATGWWATNTTGKLLNCKGLFVLLKCLHGKNVAESGQVETKPCLLKNSKMCFIKVTGSFFFFFYYPKQINGYDIKVFFYGKAGVKVKKRSVVHVPDLQEACSKATEHRSKFPPPCWILSRSVMASGDCMAHMQQGTLQYVQAQDHAQHPNYTQVSAMHCHFWLWVSLIHFYLTLWFKKKCYEQSNNLFALCLRTLLTTQIYIIDSLGS